MRTGQLTLQLTWSCDIRCRHCCQEHLNIHLPTEDARRAIESFNQLDLMTRVGFTGGEPFLRYRDLVALAELCSDLGLPFGVVTNGRWCRSRALGATRIAQLASLGLDMVVVSYDAYHADYVPISNVTSLIREAQSRVANVQMYVTEGDDTDNQETETLLARIQAECIGLTVKRRRLVPVGYGAGISVSHFSSILAELDTACPSRELCTIWPDGRVFPCCTAGTHPRLEVGNIFRDSIEDIAGRLQTSRLLDLIHREGLTGVLCRLPPQLRHQFAQRRYVSACHLCFELMNDAEIAHLLRTISFDALDIASSVLLTASMLNSAAETRTTPMS